MTQKVGGVLRSAELVSDPHLSLMLPRVSIRDEVVFLYWILTFKIV